MSLSMHEAAAPVFRQGLTSLTGLLDKAATHCREHGIDPTTLLADRLAPDMFPLTRQVQLTADFAKNTLFRLAGREPPRIEDVEATLGELQNRLARTQALLDTVVAAEVDGSEGRTITLNIRGEPMTFQGRPYLLHFALPNFFFHLTAAYAILRKNGVPIGKRDFIGPLPGA